MIKNEYDVEKQEVKKMDNKDFFSVLDNHINQMTKKDETEKMIK